MRVSCKECGSKGRIGKRDELSLTFARLYCQCLSVECGHTWVTTLAFSHTLNPSAQVVDRLIFDRLREMPRAQQQELFDQLGTLPS